MGGRSPRGLVPIDRVMPASRRGFLIAVFGTWPLACRRDAYAVADSAGRVADIEWHIVFLTNQQRIWRKLKPVESSAVLAGIARAHSQDMLTRGYFDHRSPEGLLPADRVARKGLTFVRASENIYSMEGGTTDAAELASVIVRGWMDSTGHSRNILDSGARSLGVGVAATEHTVLATQLLVG